MKSVKSSLVRAAMKEPTGIAGFDDITRGGLPRGRTTLLVGGPGSGKTVFALQFLVHGAQAYRDKGIFVAFEEAGKRVIANAQGFDWNIAALARKKLFFMDAQPNPDMIQSGDFDISGMLAGLESKVKELGARRIVFDALDVLLALLPDAAAKRRELYRLDQWLTARNLTGIITAKSDDDETTAISQQPFRFMLYMMDCAVILVHSVESGISKRNVRVLKYRGSSFDEDEAPFLIGKSGFAVAATRTLRHLDATVSDMRVSSGVARLDTMLGGGYYRASSMLITGSAGTGKTTLSGTFAEAACRRREHTLFVSFDSDGPEVIRNLSSVGIHLNRYQKNGMLRMVSARKIAGSADTYLERIIALAIAHETRCLVIDPMSTWSKSPNDVTTHSVADRLIDWAKGNDVTLVCTRLVDEVFGAEETSSPLQISTLVDTWIHLNYRVQGGERNRGLSVIKSRGTSHSNQVRELILSDTGVTLADAYTAGGEALMGTLRWEKEAAERAAQEANEVATTFRRLKLDTDAAALEVRLKSLQVELVAKHAELALLERSTNYNEEQGAVRLTRMRQLRGADNGKKEIS